MTTEELKAALNEAHKDDDPEHRDGYIKFILREVEAGNLRPVMVDGELWIAFDFAYTPAGVVSADDPWPKVGAGSSYPTLGGE